MINGSLDARRKIFIREMIAGGVNSVAEMIIAYKRAFPQCQKDESARVGGYRLIQELPVRDAITKGLEEKEQAIKRAREKELEKQAREQVISETQVDAKLSQIIMGQHKKKRNVVVFNKETKQFHKMTIEDDPDESAIVSAANLLYKRKGSFAPIGVKHDLGDSFIDALKAITNRKTKPDVSTGSH